MSEPKLFTAGALGDIEIANRVVMAPLTRNRARPGADAPYEIHAEYYAQRASAGLLITEASQIMPEGKGYAWTPGIHSEEQIAGWKKVTEAVHARGGKIVIQLWHVGRISHVDLQPDGKAPVAPSAVTAKVKTFLESGGFSETSTPRALEEAEIPGIVAAYAQAAKNAMEAGFDGVEVHAANGYLIDQFLKDGVNQRTDGYGGSIENRTRLLAEVIDAVTAAIPAGRVGVRLSPFSGANDARDSTPQETFSRAIERISGKGLAYLHVVEGQTGGPRELPEGADLDALRAKFDGAWMVNNGYDRAMAIAAVDKGEADAVAFGKAFISNPDLVTRLHEGAPLNEWDQSTFYGGTEKGYTDYPTLADDKAA